MCWSAPARLQRRDDLADVEMIVAQRDVELVEHDQPDRRIGHQLARLGPGALGRGDVARRGPGVSQVKPSPSVCHST